MQIIPSQNLTWTPCYTTLQCALLTVPLDYSNPLSQHKAHIALTLYPAQSSSSSSTKAPLLINPGGPGGSGTQFIHRLGPAIQAILGDDQPVIGFDPRGVGYSLPAADCWSPVLPCPGTTKTNRRRGEGEQGGCGPQEDTFTGFAHRVEWMRDAMGIGGVRDRHSALLVGARERAANRLCSTKDGLLPGRSILGYAKTEDVVRDMVGIIDAWDRQRSEEAKTDGKLVYWGFSYGTYLGMTFARMFPERVGRVMVDGVVDAEPYESDVWEGSLMDTDKVLGTFFEGCVASGRKCALFRVGDTAKDIQRRYERILEGLEASPATFTHPEYFFPVVLRPLDIRAIVFRVLYAPVAGFPLLAGVLNSVYEGRYEQLSGLVQDLALTCQLPGGGYIPGMDDAQRAIMCSDKRRPMNLTVEEIMGYYQRTAKVSGFADIWMTAMLQCNGWDIYKTHPVTKAEPWTSEKKVETDFPVLFLSNTYDPVTPLQAAVKMALKFKGAGLLEQKAAGHCTLAVASTCTAKRVRDYVLNGKVPPPPEVDGSDYLGGKWATCEADGAPWGTEVVGMSAEDRKLVDAWETMGEVIGEVNGWGVGKRLNLNRMR
ncbi:hypothetical protein OQA88_1212 [Cercophora sp. LCS_1]